MKHSFGESLRRLRMGKGLTQQQLADRLHLDRASIASIASIASWETDRGTSLGLSSITSTAEAYHGVAQFSHVENRFYSNVAIPLK